MITTVEPRVFQKEIAMPGVFLLDVRHPEEFAEGHIAGEHNLDVEAPDFIEQAEKLIPKGDKVAVNCKSGKRSMMAAQLLSGKGYDVINLDGGIMAWIAAGLPVEK